MWIVDNFENYVFCMIHPVKKSYVYHVYSRILKKIEQLLININLDILYEYKVIKIFYKKTFCKIEINNLY